MVCIHDDSKGETYLECFDVDGYEIYLCECGALINISDPKNYNSDLGNAMSADEIKKMIAEVVQSAIKEINDEIERARKDILNKYYD